MKRILLMCSIFAGASCMAQSTDNTWQSDNNQQSGNSAACMNVPVSLTGNTQEVTVGNMAPAMTTQNTYVYYHRRRRHDLKMAPEFADIPDRKASYPIKVNCAKEAQGMPSQAYTVTLNSADDHVKACADSTLNLTANITVTQDNEYTGNYPTSAGDKNNYKLVSKRTYKKTERRMRNAERKEERVARLTRSKVSTTTSPSI